MCYNETEIRIGRGEYMVVIICIDDQDGMLFNKRRQSRDVVLVEDIIKTVGDKRLLIDSFSENLFAAYDNVYIAENMLDEAINGDFCFVENKDVSAYVGKIEKLIIYKWNRLYPSDFKFDETLLDSFHMESTVDFKGNSHEKITKEVYVR